jgi:23S rRNA (cytosine1962-C5)-methyltransferase
MHPWVFEGVIEKIEGQLNDGDLVRVIKAEDRSFIAYGFFNSKSQIRVRLVSWTEEDSISEAWAVGRVLSALQWRMSTLGLKTNDSFRVFSSEADGLSGLTIDKFGPYLSVIVSARAILPWLESIVKMLQDSVLKPTAIRIRSDSVRAKQDGFELEDRWIGVEPQDHFVIEQGGTRYAVDLRKGQKTGFYLDQRLNRPAVAQYSRGKDVLDLFCYSGGFALEARRAGAVSTLGIDSSADALLLAKKNQELNALDQMEWQEGDAFEHLKGASKNYGMIVLDPPRFAPGRKDFEAALRKYFSLNEAAVKRIESDGILVTHSCSSAVTLADLMEVIAGVSRRSRRAAQVLEVRGAAPDHPVLLSCPETAYLKEVIVRWA